MKAKKSLFLFSVLLVLASCFDEPEFSVVPKIRFEDIYFGRSNGTSAQDSLVLTISFEDGDGNLGLGRDEYNEPFHELDYFLQNNNTLSRLGTIEVFNNLPEFLNVPDGATGKLVLHRDRQKFNLPKYNPRPGCAGWDANWRTDSVLMVEADRQIIPDVKPEQIRILSSSNPANPRVYILKDTFYVRRNPNYSNIELDFFRKPNPQSDTVRVDWYTQLCGQDFNGRFPILSDDRNALSGTIKYSMPSTSWEVAMGTGIWQIRVRVRDRDFNLSNEVYSREFTLQEITR